MSLFEDESFHAFGEDPMEASYETYLDFNLADFVAECNEQEVVPERLLSDFDVLNSRPSLLPTCATNHLFGDVGHHLKSNPLQNEFTMSHTPQLNYQSSPFQDSLLSFDNAESCFSWPSAPYLPPDIDSRTLEATSEICTTDVPPSTSPRKGARTNRRPNLRFPRSSVQVLETWLADHSMHPYPTDRDKNALKKSTGLKRSQISSWFANARKRGKVRPPPSSPVPEEPVLNLPNIENIHPFDRWRLGPMEHEAASMADIAKAVLREAKSCDPVEHYSHTKSRRSRGSSVYSGYLGCTTASISSVEITSRPGIQSLADADSHSQGSVKFSSTLSFHARSRRRRRPTLASSCFSVNTACRTTRKFQCTFCVDSFQRKHDWQRHEKSQHLPLESWTCSPHGSVNVNPVTNEITCVFCDASDPTPEHLQAHGYSACIKRSNGERTFYRKDHLRQHLRLMHRNCAFIGSMKSWNSSEKIVKSRCGFCDTKFETWAARASHLAEHYINGMTMKEWSGDWGFEPHVLKILERATLPEYFACGVAKNGDTSLELLERAGKVSAPLSKETHIPQLHIPMSLFDTYAFDFNALQSVQPSTHFLDINPSHESQNNCADGTLPWESGNEHDWDFDGNLF